MADLHLRADTSTAAERQAVDAVLGDEASAVVRDGDRLALGGTRRRRARRHLLLPGLHALQHEVGWISPGGLGYLCDVLQVPPAEAYGVATFYEMFRTTDPGTPGSVVHVCVDASCRIAGGEELAQQREAAGSRVHRGPCLGQCERAPAEFVQGCGEPDHVPADAAATTERGRYRTPQFGAPHLRLIGRVGHVDPTSLASYRDAGGYRVLARALDMGAPAVLAALDASGLSGRGGAAFPTGVKWRAVAEGRAEAKHVVVNVDESEPGTFKDRIVVEHDPFAVVEAMTIAGVTTGAEHGWIYVRGEYPLAAARLTEALDQARAAGLLGDDVAGTGRPFHVELRRGAGAYICGEETALFNSLEGFRGEPRNKPPFPTERGLFGQPTVVNNPETLLGVLDVLEHGPDDHRARGTPGSPGHRLFCVSGHVGVPGLYEVPFGTALGDLVGLAGGPTGTPRAVLLGGAAGAFVLPERFDLPLSTEAAREAGVTLGSGAVVAFDDSVDLTDVVVRIAEFFRRESCGQCVPCRIGTVRQHEVLVEMRGRGALAPERRELIDDLAVAMADASICGLGHTAASAVRSAVRLGLVG
jgi:NADH-quinone oxidoreductase subunit F